MVLSGAETTTGSQAVKSKTASSSSSSLTSAAAALTASMNNNMYRVGDYVYFEVHAGQPYQIRKIEELSRTSSGAQVEVKVQCFYRLAIFSNKIGLRQGPFWTNYWKWVFQTARYANLTDQHGWQTLLLFGRREWNSVYGKLGRWNETSGIQMFLSALLIQTKFPNSLRFRISVET